MFRIFDKFDWVKQEKKTSKMLKKTNIKQWNL